jgi:ATP-dependent helicase HepA
LPGSVRPKVGMLVVHPEAPGIARIGEVDGPRLRLDLFESAATPVAAQMWTTNNQVSRCRVGVQTRVFWQDGLTGLWSAGRVIGGGPDEYFVRQSNVDRRVAEADLRIRWDRPVADPLSVLLAGAQESPHFRDSRLPVLKDFTAQRAACASVTALPSSRVQIHAHQVQAALTVLSDPVQRYLLADEVGLGKTIEAGFVIRQRFIEDRKAKVVVLAPDALRHQWLDELLERFFIEDFPEAKLVVASHEEPEKWSRYHNFDLVVVDEAHFLAAVTGPDEMPYSQLRDLCHAVPRLLLLSATPVLQRETTYLGLLHLLDPHVYAWDRLEDFRQRLSVRRELATSVYSLDPQFSYLLPSAIEQVRLLLPQDPRFEDLSGHVLLQLDDAGDLRPSATEEELTATVAALRGHVAETYRLHRRIIRNRRSSVLNAHLDDAGVVAPFDVTGRKRPRLSILESLENASGGDALERWRVGTRDHLLDHGGDKSAYSAVLGVLTSRTGGPIGDLRDALAWRTDADESAAVRAGLTNEERFVLGGPRQLPVDRLVLDQLKDSTHQDGLAEIVAKLLPVASKRRVVVFAGRGQLAAALHGALKSQGVRLLHLHSATGGSAASEVATVAWREQGGPLVCDASAEDGRNLQMASLVIHLRLPSSPNQLEQRIGRVDRYGGTKPATQVIFGDGTGAGLTAAWRNLLINGYRIFDRSISALQDAVDRDLKNQWVVALDEGVDGLLQAVPSVSETLAEEAKALAQMDVLEMSYDTNNSSRDVALELAQNEISKDPGGALKHLLRDAEGFRFSLREDASGRVTISNGSRPPLLGPRLVSQLLRAPTASRTGWFDRWLALQHGGRVLRIGNPFVDAIARILEIDDRGRASAHWRVDATWTLDPLAYFSFDYLVETDLGPAVATAKAHGLQNDASLRRRADHLFEPFHRRIWLASNESQAVQNQQLLDWLDAPYRNNDRDVNLNADRIGALHQLFGGISGFNASAREAEATARLELERVTDLPNRRSAAAAAAGEQHAVLAAQAQARQTASDILIDDGSVLVERELATALALGIAQPRVQLVAVTCLVRSSQRWSHL